MIVSIGLTSCDQVKHMTGKTIDCSNTTGTSLVLQMINEDIEQLTLKENNEVGEHVFRGSEIRATLAQMPLKLESIRTSKTDPNSSKVFCVANVQVSLPTKTYNEANVALDKVTGYANVESVAEDYGLDSNANVFAIDIDYDLQPTDDGESVFAHVQNSSAIENFLRDIIAAIILKPKMEQQQAKNARLAAENERLTQQSLDSQLMLAKEENSDAKRQLNQLWAKFDVATQNNLMTEQKAWVDEKLADCQLEAYQQGGDISDTQIEINRLECDTRKVQKRKEYLEYNTGVYL